MSFIPVAIELSKIALVAIILWFVCEFLHMPDMAKKICQMLIALIAILSALQVAIAGTQPNPRPLSERLRVPDIITPEKK